MKKKTIYIVVTLFIAVVGIVSVGYIVTNYVSDVLFSSTNVRDNNSASAREDMIRTSCEWGRLADFPSTMRDFGIKTEGSSFTRSFRGSFSDTPETIQKWLLDSPGVQEGRSEVLPDKSIKHDLKMGGGALFGEVIVSEDMKEVSFYIVWS